MEKALAYLEIAIEENPPEKRRSFIMKHWLKVLILIFFAAVFVAGGAITTGTSVLNAGAIGATLTNVQALSNFLAGGWGFLWRAFLGVMSTMGFMKFLKWWLLK